MKSKNQLHVLETKEDTGYCAGIHELLDWQIVQYRDAVASHRLDLSKAEGRCVAWQEAEKDFNQDHRASMSEKWRVEYCGLVCPMRGQCLTALKMNNGMAERELSRVG